MNPPRYVLTPENYDGVTSALIGNGELCTTVGPTGYHTPPDEQTDIAHRTQYFVLAGRRHPGARHRLVNLGLVTRQIHVEGRRSEPARWTQEVYTVVPGVVEEYQRDRRKLGVFSMAWHAEV